METEPRTRKGRIVFQLTDAQLEALHYYAKDSRARRGDLPPHRTTNLLLHRGLLFQTKRRSRHNTTITMPAHYLLKALHQLDLPLI